jgi:hypothetical protein
MPLFRDKNTISDVAGPLFLATLAPSSARAEGTFFMIYTKEGFWCQWLTLDGRNASTEAELSWAELLVGRTYDSGHLGSDGPTNFARLCIVL